MYIEEFEFVFSIYSAFKYLVKVSKKTLNVFVSCAEAFERNEQFLI